MPIDPVWALSLSALHLPWGVLDGAGGRDLHGDWSGTPAGRVCLAGWRGWFWISPHGDPSGGYEANGLGFLGSRAGYGSGGRNAGSGKWKFEGRVNCC